MLKRTIVEGSTPEESEVAGTDKKEFKFKLGNVEHVTVKVKKGISIKAGKIPEDSDLPMGAYFTPDRLIINLKLTSGSQSSTYSIDLRVKYDQEDINASGGKQKMKLAYLAGSQWKIINGVNWGSDYYATISIPDFPSDPPIASGH